MSLNKLSSNIRLNKWLNSRNNKIRIVKRNKEMISEAITKLISFKV